MNFSGVQKMQKSASQPHMKVTTREIQILKKVKANIERINHESKSLVKGRNDENSFQPMINLNNESILLNTIN